MCRRGIRDVDSASLAVSVPRLVALGLGVSLLAGILALTGEPAQAAEVRRFLSGEGGWFQPAADGRRVAWEQNSRDRPNRYNVYARFKGTKMKVNGRRTNGANGGIDGRRLVYQQFHGTTSNLMFFNLATRDRSSPPRGVNTGAWEYWPSISDGWLLFGRRSGSGTRRIVLFNLKTKRERVLDAVSSDRSFVAPGQVNGDYAVWHRCRPGRRCSVLRYRISTRNTVKVPNSDSYHRAPSVTPSGVVYLAAAAGKACTSRVRLMRWDRPALTRVARIPLGQHIGDSYVDVDSFGNARVLFDRFVCGAPAASDIYLAEQPRMVSLSVSVSDEEAGTVTSDPEGIRCEPTCAHDYKAGTSVTLTADAKDGYQFGGWEGACSGDADCIVSMGQDRDVVATFEPSEDNALNVELIGERADDGRVTSESAGIDCGFQGLDCTESHETGTTIVLSWTTRNDGAALTAWIGDCDVEGLTCTVTLEDNKTIQAKFDQRNADHDP